MVVLVHGFASSTRDNWVLTGWIRMLEHAGYRVLAIDQRGHGASEKPHDAAGYNVRTLAADVAQVLDTYLIDEALYVGYSLGARVGWQVLRDLGDRIPRAVLGGVPDGIPLERLDLDQVRRLIADGTPVTDPVTQNYVTLTERVPGNDLTALLRSPRACASPARSIPIRRRRPAQPILFATGSEDAVDPRLAAPRRGGTAGAVLRDPRPAPLQRAWVEGVPRRQGWSSSAADAVQGRPRGAARDLRPSAARLRVSTARPRLGACRSASNRRSSVAVGEGNAKALQKAFGMTTVTDLLSHYPAPLRQPRRADPDPRSAEGRDGHDRRRGDVGAARGT